MLYTYKARIKGWERNRHIKNPRYLDCNIEGLIQVEHNENDMRPDKIRIQDYLNEQYQNVQQLKVKPVPTI